MKKNTLLRKNRPLHIRSRLYHYDFTRYNFSWHAHFGTATEIIGADDKAAWWHRSQNSEEYTPPLNKRNPSVNDFLISNGWQRPSKKEKEHTSKVQSVETSGARLLATYDKSKFVRPHNNLEKAKFFFSFHATCCFLCVRCKNCCCHTLVILKRRTNKRGLDTTMIFVLRWLSVVRVLLILFYY